MGLVILKIAALKDIQLEALAFSSRSRISLKTGMGKMTFKKASTKIGITQNSVLVICIKKEIEPIKNRGRILDNINKSRKMCLKNKIILE